MTGKSSLGRADAGFAFLLGAQIGQFKGEVSELHCGRPSHLVMVSFSVCPPM